MSVLKRLRDGLIRSRARSERCVCISTREVEVSAESGGFIMLPCYFEAMVRHDIESLGDEVVLKFFWLDRGEDNFCGRGSRLRARVVVGEVAKVKGVI